MESILTPSSFPLTQTTRTTAETEMLGAALGQALADQSALPSFVALYGDLGVGKTAFVRGMASILAPGRVVRSPTFALVNEYRIQGKKPVYHFDLYRIESEDDLYSIGYDDYLNAGICVCEWSENIPYALPSQRLEVHISKDPTDVEVRHIHMRLIN